LRIADFTLQIADLKTVVQADRSVSSRTQRGAHSFSLDRGKSRFLVAALLGMTILKEPSFSQAEEHKRFYFLLLNSDFCNLKSAI